MELLRSFNLKPSVLARSDDGSPGCGSCERKLDASMAVISAFAYGLLETCLHEGPPLKEEFVC
jgi:hypothetical protein